MLDADLSWEVAGHSLLGSATGQSTKTIYHRGATAQVTIETARLAELRDAAVKRKNAIFGPFEPGSMTPRLEARPDLVGRRLSSLTVTDVSDVRVVLDNPDRLRSFDAAADVLPAFLTGQATDIEGHAVNATLAVALNGTIVSTTKTYVPYGESRQGAWTALVDPGVFQAGRNNVDVLVVHDDRAGVTLERAYATGRFPEQLDLASRGAAEFYDIQQKGLLPREGDGPEARRWTTGDVSIAVPIDPSAPPNSLRVRVAAASQAGRPIRIDVSGCTLFEGVMPGLPWARTLPLTRCEAALAQHEVTIGIHSDLSPLPGGGQPVGLALASVNLYSGSWPPKIAAPGQARADLRLLPPMPTPFQRSDVVRLELTNTGDTAWPAAGDGVAAGAATEIVLSWRGEHQRVAEQRLPLAFTMHPGDQVREELPLVPPPDVEGDASWTVAIRPVLRGGEAIPVEVPCVLHVVERRVPAAHATGHEAPSSVRHAAAH